MHLPFWENSNLKKAFHHNYWKHSLILLSLLLSASLLFLFFSYLLSSLSLCFFLTLGSWKEVSHNTGMEESTLFPPFLSSPLPTTLWQLGDLCCSTLRLLTEVLSQCAPTSPVAWRSRSHSIYTVLWGEVWKDLKAKERWEVIIKVCHVWRPCGLSNQPEFNPGSS